PCPTRRSSDLYAVRTAKSTAGAQSSHNNAGDPGRWLDGTDVYVFCHQCYSFGKYRRRTCPAVDDDVRASSGHPDATDFTGLATTATLACTPHEQMSCARETTTAPDFSIKAGQMPF